MVGAEAAGGLSLGLLVHGGDVQNVGIIFDEALQQARHLRRVDGIVHVLNPSGEREHLALAEQLFAEVLFELQSFAGEGAGDFGLLHALGVLQFFFAEAQNLAVIEPERSDADEQKRAEHDPEDAPATGRQLLRAGMGIESFAKMLSKRAMGTTGPKYWGWPISHREC